MSSQLISIRLNRVFWKETDFFLQFLFLMGADELFEIPSYSWKAMFHVFVLCYARRYALLCAASSIDSSHSTLCSSAIDSDAVVHCELYSWWHSWPHVLHEIIQVFRQSDIARVIVSGESLEIFQAKYHNVTDESFYSCKTNALASRSCLKIQQYQR